MIDNPFKVMQIKILILRYTGKSSPPLYFRPFRPCCLKANLRQVEIYVANMFFVNTTAFGRIQDRVTPFASVKGRKLHGGENNTVYSINEKMLPLQNMV